MSRKKKASDWLQNDPDQIGWAVTYLTNHRHGGMAATLKDNFQEGLRGLDAYSTTAEGELFVRTMRGAWNRRIWNKTGDCSTYSYTLKKATHLKLQWLAEERRSTMGDTLSALILRGFQSEETLKHERKKILEQEREDRKRRKTLSRKGSARRIAEGKARTLEKEREAILALADQLLKEVAIREALMGSAAPDLTNLAPTQAAKADALYAERRTRFELQLDETLGNDAKETPPPAPEAEANGLVDHDFDSPNPEPSESEAPLAPMKLGTDPQATDNQAIQPDVGVAQNVGKIDESVEKTVTYIFNLFRDVLAEPNKPPKK